MKDTALTYSQMILGDYHEFIKVLSKNNDNMLNLSDSDKVNFEELHKILYFFKELQIELNYPDQNVKDAFSETINGFLDFMWLIGCCRYKVSVLTLRSAMEMYVKGLAREMKLNEVDSFSNNIEVVSKEIPIIMGRELRITPSKQKKMKKYINLNYSTRMKDIYWDCSDIAHGRLSTFSDFSKYMENVLNLSENYNRSNHQEIMETAIEVIRLMIELLIIIEFNKLSDVMNSTKIEHILGNLSVKFNRYKDTYLL